MSKLESNIQLPTVIFGALLALIIERATTLIFIVPAQNYAQDLAEEYQFAGEGEDIPFFIENFVLNGLLPQILVLIAVAVFALAFYFFVVRDKRVSKWQKQDSKSAAKKPAAKKKATTKK